MQKWEYLRLQVVYSEEGIDHITVNGLTRLGTVHYASHAALHQYIQDLGRKAGIWFPIRWITVMKFFTSNVLSSNRLGSLLSNRTVYIVSFHSHFCETKSRIKEVSESALENLLQPPGADNQ